MANHPSAAKADKQSKKKRARNRNAMSTLRTAIKRARAAVDAKDAEASVVVKAAISVIDKNVSKGILKKNTAARYVSRLATRGSQA